MIGNVSSYSNSNYPRVENALNLKSGTVKRISFDSQLLLKSQKGNIRIMMRFGVYCSCGIQKLELLKT